MKVLLILSTLVALSSTASRHYPGHVDEGPYDLRSAFQEIRSIVDFDDLLRKAATINWMTCPSSSFDGLTHGVVGDDVRERLWSEPEFRDVIVFIANSGFPQIYDVINQIYEIMGFQLKVNPNGAIRLPPNTYVNPNGVDCPNAQQLRREIIENIDYNKLMFTIASLIKKDASAKALHEKLKTKAALYKQMKQMPQVQHIQQAARESGIKALDIINNAVEAFFNWY